MPGENRLPPDERRTPEAVASVHRG